MTQDQDEFIDTISQLPGVGQAKAEALWEAGYRSLDEVREASAEELADEVDGVGPSLAESIQEGLEDLEAEAEPEPDEGEEADEEAEEPEDEPEPEAEPEAEDELIDTISQLPGVGEAKAEALWEAGYRSLDEIQASSAEELADEVDGVGPKLADAILQGIEDLETEPEPEVEIVEEAEEEEEPEPAAEIVEEDEHIPKPKPDLDEETKRALKIRKRIQDQRPTFVRRNWWQFPKFDKDHSWRKPRGQHSKMREDRQHAPKRVKVGYRGPKQARGLHPSGFEDVLVHNTDELEGLDPDTQAARIASAVGQRKRIKIIEEAQEMGIHVLNPGEVST